MFRYATDILVTILISLIIFGLLSDFNIYGIFITCIVLIIISNLRFFKNSKRIDVIIVSEVGKYKQIKNSFSTLEVGSNGFRKKKLFKKY